MKLQRAVVAVAILLITASTGPSQARRESEPPKFPAPPLPRPYDPSQSRESLLKQQLQKMLPGLSVPDDVVRDTDEPQARASYRVLRVRWDVSDPAAPERTEFHSIEREPSPFHDGRVMKVIGRGRAEGLLGRQRALDLNPENLLYVCVDAAQRIRYWYVVPDPRVVTTEALPQPGAAGEGRRVYHSAHAEFLIGFPDDPSVRELRFYHPRWTGAEYVLELIEVISL